MERGMEQENLPFADSLPNATIARPSGSSEPDDFSRFPTRVSRTQGLKPSSAVFSGTSARIRIGNGAAKTQTASHFWMPGSQVDFKLLYQSVSLKLRCHDLSSLVS